MILLLENRGGAEITEDAKTEIVRRFSEDVVKLLLEKADDQIQITDEVVKATAENRRSGKNVMILLLENQGGSQITKAAKTEIIRRFNEDVVKLLLEKAGDQIQITDEVVKAAAENRRSRKKVMILLLENQDEQVQFKESVILETARRFSEDVVKLLLEKAGDQVQITDQVVKAAAENRRSGKEVMILLLENRGGAQIMENARSEIARRFNEDVVKLLLEKAGDQIQITDEVVKAAAENRKSGKEVMILLLENQGGAQIMENARSEIARRFDEDIVKLLLKKAGDQIQITDEVVKATAENQKSEEVITLLLENQDEQVQFKESVILETIRRFSEDVVKLLLEKAGDQIQITDEVVKAAAENRKSGKEVMILLLENRGGAEITENARSEIARRFNEDVVKALLEKADD